MARAAASGARRRAVSDDDPSPRAGRPAQGRELRARGQRTLRKLLDAGIQVFETRGYHAARVDDVVKLARTSHGTFYLYFANKEDLFAALTAEVATSMHERAEALPPLEDGLPALREWVAGLADLYDKYAAVIVAWTEAEIGESNFGRMGDDLISDVAGALARRIRAVGSDSLDPQVAALALVAMIERLLYYAMTRQVHVDRDAMIETLASVTYTAICT
ncbi:MAG TPA: helix-turn-helix domain-containing protein [Acidimicrobiia bacterium]|jgi:AcrR family transcriptional regulator|nr:helix-turn-helix domain-containing protein [Acidimicrobiia bacterium]